MTTWDMSICEFYYNPMKHYLVWLKKKKKKINIEQNYQFVLY